MIFNIKMFESEKEYAVVKSVGYESVLKHRHEFVELVYVERGTAVQKLSYETINLKQGDMFIISDDSEHSTRPTCDENEFELINIIFLKSFLEFDYSVFQPIVPFNTLHLPEIPAMINRAKKEYEERRAFCNEAMKGCLYFLLTSLARMYEAGMDSKPNKNRNLTYVMLAVKFIADNYSKRLKLEDVADHVGLTSGYLQKLFRKERKTSVIEYLLRYRIEQGCRYLVETNNTIVEISEVIGFSDIKNFHYAFKKVLGMTPNEYRRIHKNKTILSAEEK